MTKDSRLLIPENMTDSYFKLYKLPIFSVLKIVHELFCRSMCFRLLLPEYAHFWLIEYSYGSLNKSLDL